MLISLPQMWQTGRPRFRNNLPFFLVVFLETKSLCGPAAHHIPGHVSTPPPPPGILRLLGVRMSSPVIVRRGHLLTPAHIVAEAGILYRRLQTPYARKWRMVLEVRFFSSQRRSSSFVGGRQQVSSVVAAAVTRADVGLMVRVAVARVIVFEVGFFQSWKLTLCFCEFLGIWWNGFFGYR